MSERVPYALLAAVCLVPLIWPGDVPFINDEPKLIALALDANAAHRLAPIGLLGTYGLQYGPVPVWLYQALLVLTHDLVVIAVLHAAIMTAATAAALWWLARSLHLWAWFAPLPLLSPYFWQSARSLWDNPLLIPLGALAIAGYAAHLSNGSRAGLRVAVVCLPALVLVHLMALALVVPLATHLLLVRWREVRGDALVLGAIASTALVLAWPYWTYLLNAWPDAGSATGGDFRGWRFPLSGGRLLSADRLDYMFGSAAVGGTVMHGAAMVSRLAHALVLGGIALAAWNTWTARSRPWTPRDHVIAIALAGLALQVLFDGVSGKFHHPQYQHATWIVFVLMAWITVERLLQLREPLCWSGVAVTGILAVALSVSLLTLATRLHANGGTRETYGPTLANQLRVARELARYAPATPVESQVWLYRLFPHTLETLRRLEGPEGALKPVSPLTIRYVSPDPAVGAIELVSR